MPQKRKRGSRGGRRRTATPVAAPAPAPVPLTDEELYEDDIPEVPPEGPLTFAPQAREIAPAPQPAQAAPGSPPAQYPSWYIAALYGQIAQPLANVLFALSHMRGELAQHPLRHPDLDPRLGNFIEALTATHTHVGAVLAVLQEMQEEET